MKMKYINKPIKMFAIILIGFSATAFKFYEDKIDYWPEEKKRSQ